jgi:Spy/CpxP family protein refolding chaperone
MKKITLRKIARLPKMLEAEIDECSQEAIGDLFMRDAKYQQAFRDYIGIDKKSAENIRKKQVEVLVEHDDGIALYLKIAQASTDDEVDKLIDQMAVNRLNKKKKLTAVLTKELNPQQLEKLKEVRMVHSSINDTTTGLFDFSQYEALNLTDEQQKKISVIKTEYTVAIEPLYKRMFEVRQRERLYGLTASNKPEAAKKATEDVEKEFSEALQPITKLNAATRARILALFTKEQTAKLEKVLSNAPKYLMKRVGLENKDAWKPSDSSWKPGDGPTAEYLERQRQNPKTNKQFPRSE